VKVDEKSMTLKIRRVPVLVVTIKDGKINLDWLDGTWETWKELVESPELRELIETAEGKLSKSAAAQNKGKGKGPDPSGVSQSK
jgi:hypothetical protein